MPTQQAAPDTPPQPNFPPQPDVPRSDAPPQPEPSPRARLALGRIAGDLRIQPWANSNGDTPRARILAHHGTRDLLPGAPALDVDDDATLMVAGPVDLAINQVEGDLVVARLGGALDVKTVDGDATLNAVSGPVTLSEVHGDATAVNLADDLTIITVQGDIAVDHIGGATRMDTVQGDLILRRTGQVEISSVKGDLRAQDVASLAVARSVHGDVTLDQLDQVTIRHVKGDLTAVSIGGLLQVAEVNGDARLRSCSGQVRLAEVAGELAAQDLTGGIIAECDSEAYLESRLAAGMTYQITAVNIVLRARSPISAQFVAQSTGGEIRTHLPLTVERHRQTLAGVIGQGEAIVTLMSTGGDIILDAAGSESAEERDRPHSKKDHFRVHVGHGPHGPTVDIDGIPGLDFSGWPFSGGFSMSDKPSTPHDFSELEERLQDLGERSGRAARKAAEKFREYADRAAKRARETDWEAVSRDIRTAIERTVGELEAAFREIMAEFEGNPPTAGSDDSTTKAKSGSTAQRIPIDPDPVDATATVVDSTPDRDARRRAILEQVRSGELTLEQAEEQLRNL